MIHNILSSNEITYLLNNPVVNANKESLSHTQPVVKFSISLPDVIKAKLENSLSIELSQIERIPMRWVKGDTLPHIDKGEKHFNNTYLIYLTDSIGDLIIDGQTYSITAGDAHIFSEGLQHSTINTGNSERLMIGPMSESGFQVGLDGDPIVIYYYDNETDAGNEENAIGYYSSYTIETVNEISSWVILKNNNGLEPTPNGGPRYAGDSLITSGIYYLYPYISQPAPQARRILSMGSLFTNNAQVYYKPGSLSTGGGGSGVTNSRHKQRRT
jgi:hypothetical protein